MNLAKRSNWIGRLKSVKDAEDYLKVLDTDTSNLFLMSQARVRFGGGTTAIRGENIDGEWRNFTSSATSDTEFSVAHLLAATPIGRIVCWQDKNGVLYQGPTTGTAWNSTTVYFKCTVASVNFLIFLLK